MSEYTYAVFLFPQAMEALADTIKPYLTQAPGGVHIRCTDVDTSGAFVQMHFLTQDKQGNPLEMSLMIPGAMVRLIASVRGEHEFGFT